jgi:prolyl oligopeptidase
MTKRILATIAISLMCASMIPAQTTFNYPKPRKSDQVDDYHGTKVPDPYRWMEDDNAAEVKAWIEAENKLTSTYLEGIPQRSAIKARLTELWNYERFSAPVKVGDRYVYTKNDGLQNRTSCTSRIR